jgi:hypothetical protein
VFRGAPAWLATQADWPRPCDRRRTALQPRWPPRPLPQRGPSARRYSARMLAEIGPLDFSLNDGELTPRSTWVRKPAAAITLPRTAGSGRPVHDSRKAAGESEICGLSSAGRSAPAQGSAAQLLRTAFLKKNPPLATGISLGRNGRVSRFAAGLCVVIHTRRGKPFGPPGTKRGGLHHELPQRPF